MRSHSIESFEEPSPHLQAAEPHKLLKKESSSLKIFQGDHQIRSDNLLILQAPKTFTKYSIFNEIKERFYDLHRKIKAGPPISDTFRKDLQKEIASKSFTIFNAEEILFHFERIIRKTMSALSSSNTKKWNQHETQFLISLVAYYAHLYEIDRRNISEEQWEILASAFPKQVSKDELKLKWLSLLKTTVAMHPWKLEEDELLAAIVTKYDGSRLDWKKITYEYNHQVKTSIFRPSKQCRERWDNHLNQNMNKGGWTGEEDIQLANCVVKYGKKWAEISKIFGDRTENAVRNRWTSLEKRFRFLKTSLRSESEEEKASDVTFELMILNELKKSQNLDAMASMAIVAGQKRGESMRRDLALMYQKRTGGKSFDSNILTGNLSIKESQKPLRNIESSFNLNGYKSANLLPLPITDMEPESYDDLIMGSSFGEEVGLSPSGTPADEEVSFYDFNDFNQWEMAGQQVFTKSMKDTTKTINPLPNSDLPDLAAITQHTQLGGSGITNANNRNQLENSTRIRVTPNTSSAWFQNVNRPSQLTNHEQLHEQSNSIPLESFKFYISTSVCSFNERRNRLLEQANENPFALIDFKTHKIQLLDKETYSRLQSSLGISSANSQTNSREISQNIMSGLSYGPNADFKNNRDPFLEPSIGSATANYPESRNYQHFTGTQLQIPTHFQGNSSQYQMNTLPSQLHSQRIFHGYYYYSGSA